MNGILSLTVDPAGMAECLAQLREAFFANRHERRWIIAASPGQPLRLYSTYKDLPDHTLVLVSMLMRHAPGTTGSQRSALTRRAYIHSNWHELFLDEFEALLDENYLVTGKDARGDYIKLEATSCKLPEKD